MSKAGNFKKFTQKKKNSVIKEEFRKEKKEWKKELTDKRIQRKKQIIKADRPAQKSFTQSSQGKESIKGEIPLNKYIAHSGVCGRGSGVGKPAKFW
jgi:23S rRNA pseudouridine2605 synthase